MWNFEIFGTENDVFFVSFTVDSILLEHLLNKRGSVFNVKFFILRIHEYILLLANDIFLHKTRRTDKAILCCFFFHSKRKKAHISRSCGNRVGCQQTRTLSGQQLLYRQLQVDVNIFFQIVMVNDQICIRQSVIYWWWITHSGSADATDTSMIIISTVKYLWNKTLNFLIRVDFSCGEWQSTKDSVKRHHLRIVEA